MITTERRKPVLWTAEEDAELKRIYSISIAGQAATAIRRLAEKKGIDPRQVYRRAGVLSLSRASGGHRVWTEAEIDNLRHYLGRLPVYRIARILARSRESVNMQIWRLQLSGRVKERGYTKRELADLMGIDLDHTLNEMLRRWPMKKNAVGNYSQAEVGIWVWEHLDDIELRKCDQSWLKRLLREAA